MESSSFDRRMTETVNFGRGGIGGGSSEPINFGLKDSSGAAIAGNSTGLRGPLD